MTLCDGLWRLADFRRMNFSGTSCVKIYRPIGKLLVNIEGPSRKCNEDDLLRGGVESGQQGTENELDGYGWVAAASVLQRHRW